MTVLFGITKTSYFLVSWGEKDEMEYCALPNKKSFKKNHLALRNKFRNDSS